MLRARSLQVRYLLKDLTRDWSAEGAGERAQSYGWLADALGRHLPPRRDSRAAAHAATPADNGVTAARSDAAGSTAHPEDSAAMCSSQDGPGLEAPVAMETTPDSTSHAASGRERDGQDAGAAQPQALHGSDACGGQGGKATGAAEEEPPPRVLVPGCGLGRLVVELAAAGYEAVGVEFSFYMLLALRCACPSALATLKQSNA